MSTEDSDRTPTREESNRAMNAIDDIKLRLKGLSDFERRFFFPFLLSNLSLMHMLEEDMDLDEFLDSLGDGIEKFKERVRQEGARGGAS